MLITHLRNHMQFMSETSVAHGISNGSAQTFTLRSLVNSSPCQQRWSYYHLLTVRWLKWNGLMASVQKWKIFTMQNPLWQLSVSAKKPTVLSSIELISHSFGLKAYWQSFKFGEICTAVLWTYKGNQSAGLSVQHFSPVLNSVGKNNTSVWQCEGQKKTPAIWSIFYHQVFTTDLSFNSLWTQRILKR